VFLFWTQFEHNLDQKYNLVLHLCNSHCGKNVTLTTIREILGALFFFQSKKIWRGHVVKEAFLGYKCWYKRRVALPRQCFCVVGRGQSWYSARATLFVFFKTFFAQIFDL
jgi:hypothetical protein